MRKPEVHLFLSPCEASGPWDADLENTHSEQQELGFSDFIQTAKRHLCRGRQLASQAECVQAHPRPSPQLCPLQAFLLRDRFFCWEMAMAILCGRSALRTKTESSRLMLHTPFVLVVSHCLK